MRTYGCLQSVEARTRELAKSLEELHTIQDRLVQTQKLASLGQLTAASEKFYFGHVPELCWLGSAVISLSSKAVQVRAKKPSPSCLHTFSVCLITRHNERQPCHRSRNNQILRGCRLGQSSIRRCHSQI